ncbi:MAG: protein kinase [Acidobacteria bacterium]|nr:protein kinase [Acidobacteriota bacterium]
MFVDLKPGMLLGDYRLVSVIGHGGMGTVWRATHEALGREVAVKVLPEHLVNDESARKRFYREARVLAQLVHPNIVTIFDVGSVEVERETMPYIVMELLHGRSLDVRISGGDLGPQEAVRIAMQIARALGAAHRAGIVHRDLKPSNVIVDSSGHVKVLDFGLARLLQPGAASETTLTETGIVLGSCAYMSPEQASGDTIGPPSDVFSFGSLVFEMLTGRRAFEGPTPVTVLEQVAKAKKPAIEEVAPQLPPSLVAIIERCMEKNPERRYADGEELAQDLGTIDASAIGSYSQRATQSSPVVSRPQALASRRRKRLKRALVYVLAGLTAGVLAGFLTARHGYEPLRPDPGLWTSQEVLQTRGQLAHPDWNPSGKWLAVEHLQGAEGEIILVASNGARRRRLARAVPGHILAWPHFSPDGSALAVTEIGGPSSQALIYPAVGGSPTAKIANAAHASWVGPHLVAFSRFAGTSSSLWEHDLTTGNERELLPADGGTWWWAAERNASGRMAVLGGPNDVRGGIWIMGRPGGRPVPWLRPGRKVAGFSWASGGRSLAVSIDDRLAQLGPEGLRPLVPSLDHLTNPAFDSSGTRLAIVRNHRQTELVAVPPSGGSWSCLACNVPGMGWGSTGPGGTVLYGRVRGHHREIEMTSPRSAPRVVSPPGEDASCPVLSPDGARVAYLSRTAGMGTELRVIALDGGEPVTLATGVEGSELVSWSPDGRFLTYAGGSPTSVFTVATAGGAPNRLTEGDYPAWSPRGTWIALAVWTDESDPRQGTWVIHPDGTGALKVSDSPTRTVWRPDGRALWQLRRGKNALELWECSVKGWRWRRRSVLDLGVPPVPYAEYFPFSVDPGTGALAIHRRTTIGELIVFSGIDPRRWKP